MWEFSALRLNEINENEYRRSWGNHLRLRGKNNELSFIHLFIPHVYVYGGDVCMCGATQLCLHVCTSMRTCNWRPKVRTFFSVALRLID